MKFRKLLILAVSVVIAVSAAGCGQSGDSDTGLETQKKASLFSKVNTYSAKDLWDITLTGDDGTGTLKATRNRDYIKKIISECMPEDATDMEEAAYEVLLETIEIDGEPYENLSNGDKVEIHISLDEESLKQRGIAFTDTDFTYTVEGLEEFREIDIFKDVVINYEGISPNVKAEAVYQGTDEFVINNVDITANFGYVKNGDTVTAKAKVKYDAEQTAEEAKVKFKEETKEYTVENMDEYVNYEFDSAAIDGDMDKRVTETMENSTNYGVGAETEGRGFFHEGTREEKYRVLKQNITPVRVDLYMASNYNEYRRYYRINFDIENVGTGEKTVSENLYMVMTVKNVIKKSDGTVYYDDEEVTRGEYGYSIMGNYIGSDLSEIVSKELYGRDVVFEKEFE